MTHKNCSSWHNDWGGDLVPRKRLTRASLNAPAVINDGARDWVNFDAPAIQPPTPQPVDRLAGITGSGVARVSETPEPVAAPLDQTIKGDTVITEEEKAKYGIAGIAHENAGIADPNRGKIPSGRTSWAAAQMRQTAFNQATDMVPAALKDQGKRQDYVAANFPTLLAAQKAAGLSEKEVASTTNFVLAADAAKRIITSVDPRRQSALLESMPPAQQGLVLDIIQGIGKAAQDLSKNNTFAQDQLNKIAAVNNDPNLLQRGMKILGIAVGDAIDAMTWANEQAQHLVRSTAPMLQGQSFADAWQQTEPGVYDQKALDYARKTYGDKAVDLILEFRKTHESGATDVLGSVIKNHENDPEALTMIDQLINKLDSNQQLQDLVTYIDSANYGEIGNMWAWSFGASLGIGDTPYSQKGFEYANSALFTGAKTGSSIYATFGLDPTIFAGRVMGIYKGLRYGLGGLKAAEDGTMATAMGARIDKVFQTRGVRNYFDKVLGPQLKAISEETDIGKRAQMFNSVTAQHRRNFKPEALAMMEKAGVRDAASASEFFQSGDMVTNIFLGQSARRVSEVVVPHMTIANVAFKKASMAVRGATWDKMGSARWIDGVFGAGTSDAIAREIDYWVQLEHATPTGVPAMSPAQFAQKRTDVVKGVQNALAEQLSQPGADRQIGEFLSKFQFADGEAKRTFIGKMIATISGTNAPIERGSQKVAGPRFALGRYGFASEGRFDPRTRLERISRLMSRRPNTGNGLYIGDARDAEVVRQIFLAGGVNPYWANFSKYLWVHSTEAQRRIAANGIARTFGYATGMHVVDPELGIKEIGRMAESMGQKYAPDVVDLAQLRKTARNIRAQEVRRERSQIQARQSAIAQLQQQGGNPAALTALPPVVPARSLDDIFLDLRGKAIARNPGQYIDADGNIQNSAVFYSQTESRVRLPDLAKAEALGIRQSYLQAFLGNNHGIQTLTDLWVLGTLLGPRFQTRSGIEDFAFYGLTKGSMSRFRTGRMISTAIRESTGQKLGIVKTTGRAVADKADELAGHLPVDVAEDAQAVIRGTLLPHLSPEEVRLADAALQAGDRRVLVKLMNKAVLRRRWAWANGLKKVGLNKTARRVRMSRKQERAMGYIDDLVKYDDNPFDAMGEVSETAGHLVDGTMPRARMGGIEENSNAKTMFIGGEAHKVVMGDSAFTTRKFGEKHDMNTAMGSLNAHEEWMDNIVLAMVHDGIKGRAAVRLIKDYWKAKNLKTPNPARVQAVVQQLADIITYADKNYTPYLTRMSHGAREGAEGLATRTLQSVEAMFVDDLGRFNHELYDRLVRFDASTGKWDVRLSDKGVPRVTIEDLRGMDVKPQSVLVPSGLPVVVGDGTTFAKRAWDATGRSLARLTREPIFVANYTEIRDYLLPFEKAMAERFGPTYAKRWAVDVAQRRAVESSMDYLDNPGIRSNLAWHLRNVARFYRASEDFNRRMVRVFKNHPEFVWKVALGWNMLDDTGFVHVDEFGNKYFVWPGSAVAFRAINAVTSTIFQQPMMSPGADLAFSSGVAMLTPSADPNSWTPTMSGPYTALALKGLVRLIPGLNGLETNLFGPYSESQELWRGILPPNLVRAADMVMTGGKGEVARRSEAGTPFATYFRQAAQIFAFNNPDFENRQWTDTELQSARSEIDHMAMDLMFFKGLTSPVFPASIQSQAITVTDFARGLGIDGLRESFVQLQRQYYDDPGKAFAIWWKMNPNLSPFTVSSTNSNRDIGSYQPFSETVDFIEANKEEAKANPLGTSFFAPQHGSDPTQQLAAWTYLQRMGVYVPKDVDQIFKETITSRGYNKYQILKGQYETLVAQRDKTADGRWTAAKQALMQEYPQLDSRLRGELSTNRSVSKSDYTRDVESVRRAATYFGKQGNPLAERYQYALGVYDSAKASFDQLPANTDDYKTKRDDVRQRWVKGFVPQMIRQYGDDEKFKSFLYILSGSLGFEVN